MRYSALFTKTRKEAPKDEVSKNAQLLVRAGFVHKEMAGVYTYLPLGLRVFTKIENIIREEMNAIGGQEMLLTTLQDPKVWEMSDRWSDESIDVWFKSQLSAGGDIGIANTHEEPVTNLMTNHIRSHHDLPVYVYQIQNKFRNELRAKSGLMRGREFVMKDLYSFNRTEEEFRAFYEQAANAYLKIFERAGIGDRVFRTFASGGSFSQFSDEFQALSEAGEDIIYISREKNIALNREVYTDEVITDLGLDKATLEEAKAIEVGNIFPLGTRFPKALGLTYQDENGESQYPVMGSYGIGLGRLMGTVVEILADEKGIVWPVSIAPYRYHLISLGNDEAVRAMAEKVYHELTSRGIEVLYDDRDLGAGAKFADADLIGIPTQLAIGKKTIEKGEVLEVTDRKTGESSTMALEEIINNV